MTKTKQQRSARTYWVGLDVSKRTFDAALAGPDQRYQSTPLRALPWKAFPRTHSGVKEFLARLDDHAPKGKTRVIMEATGRYSVELTSWMLTRRPTL